MTWRWDLDGRIQAARQAGARYMLVCYDTWDSRGGDGDSGYYYPRFATAQEVRDFLAGKQLDEDRTSNADVCRAVIDLTRVEEHINEAHLEKPSVWLARMTGLSLPTDPSETAGVGQGARKPLVREPRGRNTLRSMGAGRSRHLPRVVQRQEAGGNPIRAGLVHGCRERESA